MTTTSVTLATGSDQLPAINTEAGRIIGWVNGLIISNTDEFNSASKNLATIKDWKKRAEDDKERLYRPIKTALDTVSAEFKPVLDQLTQAESLLRGKMTTFDAAEKAKRLKAEEEARKAREEEALRMAREREAAVAAEQARLKADAEARAAELRAQGDEDLAESVEAQATAGIEAMASAHENATDLHFSSASTMTEIAKTTQLDGGAFTTRMVKKVRITNPMLLPRQFLMPDEAKIQQALLREGLTIPGAEVYEEPQGSMRRAA